MKIWLWTWKLTGDQAIQSTLDALQIGYRAIDTARIYGNEKEIAAALAQSQIPRSALHLTTKIRFDYVPNYQKHQFVSTDFLYTQREARFEQTLQDLQTDYLDEVLLHRPTRVENDTEILSQLFLFQKKWLIKKIGVANFPFSYLQKFPDELIFQLSTDQIELHPCLLDPQLLAYAKNQKLTLTAYSPLAHGKILDHPVLNAIASKHSALLWKLITPAQVCIARCLSLWCRVIPKANSFERLQQNRNAQFLQLDAEDLEMIASLPKHFRYCNPPFAPKWD